MARPLKYVDEVQLEKLCKLQLSTTAIAQILNISIDTLERRYAAEMEQWRFESKGKIAEVLFDEGVNHRTPWALKALAQKHLDYYDRVKSENENTNHNSELSEEELDIKIAEKLKVLKHDKE